MKKHFTTILLVLLFLTGLSVMLYPTFSDWWNSTRQSYAIRDYNSIIQNMKEDDFQEEFDKADSYNVQLAAQQYPMAMYENVPGYEEALNISKDGMMGYLLMEKLNLKLPIYHGTSPDVLNRNIGHLEGSSLPVGGLGTHAVLSAHRGLPSAKLFSDLDQVEIGDTFQIQVLDRIMTYQVDQIKVVLPDETDDLMIDPDQDYCTLITCTPYGVNTHRMLVRGTRIENQTGLRGSLPNEAFPVENSTLAPFVVIPAILLILLAAALRIWQTRRKKRKQKEQEAEAEKEETAEETKPESETK